MTPSQESPGAGDGHEGGVTLTWLGAALGLFGPGWQGSFRVAGDGEPRTIVISLDASETDAIARHLGQSKLDKRQAELVLQYAGRELIDAALQGFELPDEVRVTTLEATRTDDLRRWRVLADHRPSRSTA